MPGSRRDEDRIARADHSTFAIEFYLARALEDEIKLLRDLVIVPLCPASRGDARFRKALVLNGRIRAIENRTDSRAVLRDKRRRDQRFWTVMSLSLAKEDQVNENA